MNTNTIIIRFKLLSSVVAMENIKEYDAKSGIILNLDTELSLVQCLNKIGINFPDKYIYFRDQNRIDPEYIFTESCEVVCTGLIFGG